MGGNFLERGVLLKPFHALVEGNGKVNLLKGACCCTRMTISVSPGGGRQWGC